MRIFLTILTLTFLTSADFTNDGAALTIDEGCIVTMDGDYESTGTLELNGTLQISGYLGNVNTIDHSNQYFSVLTVLPPLCRQLDR